MKKFVFIMIILVFALGWIAGNAYTSVTDDFEYYEYYENNDSDSDRTSFPSIISKERDSPVDRISESNIHVKDNQVTIDIEGAEWSRFTDTNSMDPIIDKGANAIHIVPKAPEEIQIGDIIAYNSKLNSGTIIHRVVEIDTDEDGIFFRTKGDNVPYKDPEKIRFEQVERVLVAIIY